MDVQADISETLFKVIDSMVNLEFSDPEPKKSEYELSLGKNVQHMLLKLKPNGHMIVDDSLVPINGRKELFQMFGIKVVYNEYDWAIILRRMSEHDMLIDRITRIVKRL